MQGLLRTVLAEVGDAALHGASSLGRTFKRPFETRLWIEQIHAVGVGSLTLTNLTLLFTGMVLAVQTAHSPAVRLDGGRWIQCRSCREMTREKAAVSTASTQSAKRLQR